MNQNPVRAHAHGNRSHNGPAKNMRNPIHRIQHRSWRAAPFMAALLALAFAATGCSAPVDMKKLERNARMQQNRMTLPRELTRPRHLEPFSGEYPGGQDVTDPGFTINIPPGGWFRNTGLGVPDAAAIFVHGDTDPFDIVVAVAPAQPALEWASPSLADDLRALATDYFKKWNKDLTPAPGSDFQSLEANPPRAGFTGYFGQQDSPQSAAPRHDTARVFAFPEPGGGTALLVFTYPEIFERRLEMHISDIASSFRTR